MINLDNILLIRLTNTKPSGIVDIYFQILKNRRIPDDPTYLPEHITLEYTVGRLAQTESDVNCYKYAYIIPLSSVLNGLYSISPNANIFMKTTLKEKSYILCPNDEVKDLEVKFGHFYKGKIVGYNHDKNLKCGSSPITSETSTKPEEKPQEKPEEKSQIKQDIKVSELSLYNSINKILSAVQGDLVFTIEGSKLHIGLNENPIPAIDILPKDSAGNRVYKDNRLFIDKYEMFVRDVNQCINYNSKDKGAQDNIKKYCSTRNSYTPIAKNIDERALARDQILPVFVNSFLYISMSLSIELNIILNTRAMEPVLKEFLEDIAKSIRYAGIIAEFYGKYFEFNYNFMYNPITDEYKPIQVRKTLLNIRKTNPFIKDIEKKLYRYAKTYEEGETTNEVVDNFIREYNKYKVELRKIYEIFESKAGLHKFE